MIWLWSLPWLANLILLFLIGVLGLRVTVEFVAVLMPQYRSVVLAVDRAAKRTVILCLRVLLGASIVTLTTVVYLLFLVDFVTRRLLRGARFVGARLGLQLPIPIPESPRLPRVSLLVLVQPPEVKPTGGTSGAPTDGSLTSVRG